MIALNLILLSPFFSALILGTLYLANPDASREKLYAAIALSSVVLGAFLALVIGWGFVFGDTTRVESTIFEWLHIGGLSVSLTLVVDTLSMVMLFFVTFVGAIIHLYSVGYMRGEGGFGKFFAYLNLFMGSMLLLILADNPIIMFIGWELVGLSSYLLIGFYHHEYDNITAANKAFIVNRIGDFGFIIALALIFVTVGENGMSFEAIESHIGGIDGTLLGIIGLLLFVGAMGKSAQIPLFVWLPDAMAGPTPVSALIHAATMVTAGIYMIVRFDFLYVLIPNVGEFIAIIGIASALLAAVIASFQSDIKKILAYSTISQLGYMFVAVGVGGYSQGLFHVFTHAFFKALLFLGAGALIIALSHEQNIFRMGGLRKDHKLLFYTMLIATLSIVGVPPFAGFFSKDAILVTLLAGDHYTLWALATVGVFLTSYYMFRLFFVVFYATPYGFRVLKPLPLTMTIPLVILAVGTTLLGLLGVSGAYGGGDLFAHFVALEDTPHAVEHSREYLLAIFNLFVVAAGAGLAYRLFGFEAEAPQPTNRFKKMVINKFYIDEIYSYTFVKPLHFIAPRIGNIIDNRLIDKAINFGVVGYRRVGEGFAKLQNGRVRFYTLYMLLGISYISYYILTILGGL